MKIDVNANYSIKLLEENRTRTDHITYARNDLMFTGKDLLDAIVFMGMLPSDINSKSVNVSRRDEIKFKRILVEACLDVIPNNSTEYLVMKKSFFKYLDSTEKGAIRYWIGMFFATLLARKKYRYEYVIHYSRFVNSNYCRMPIQPTTVPGSSIKPNSRSTPDLITVKNNMKEYGVFEAKGYNRYNSKTMEHAYDQVKRIGIVNNVKTSDNIVSFSVLNFTDNSIRFKDPLGEEKIEIDIYMALLWQYMPVIELLNEVGYETVGEYNVLKSIDDNYSIKVRMNTYEIFNSLRERIEREPKEIIDNSSMDEIHEKIKSVIVDGKLGFEIFENYWTN